MSMLGQTSRNRRRSRRASVLLRSSVVTMSAYQYPEVINLSPTGAKLRGPTLPGLGETAIFRLDGFEVLCKVMWVKEELCGIGFDEPIPAAVLAEFRTAGDIRKFGMLTLDEQQAKDLWTMGHCD